MTPRDAIAETAQRAGHAVAWGAALKVLRFALMFVAHLLIRRVLGADAVGQYFLAMSAMEIASALASVGMGQAALRFLPELRLGRSRAALRRFLGWTLGFQVLGWLATLAVVAGTPDWLTTLARTDAKASLIVVAMWLLICRLAFDVATQVYQALLEMRFLAGASLLWQVLFLGSLLTSFQMGGGVVGVLVAGAVANVAAFGVLAAGLWTRSGTTGDRELLPLTLRRVLAYSVPFVFIRLCHTVVWRNSESFFINYHWGDFENGCFGVAYGFPQLILEFIPTAIWPVVMASYSAVFTIDQERARRLLTTYFKLLFLIAAPLSVGGAVLGDRALVVAYGQEYAPGAFLAQVFFLVQCVSFFGTPLSMTLYILEKTWLNLAVWIGAAILNVGLNAVLIPWDWRWGAVIPVTLAVAAMPLCYSRILERLGYVVSIPWGFLVRAYAGSSGLIVLWLVRDRVSDAASLLWAALAATVLLAAGMKAVGVFRADDAGLIRLVPGHRVRRALAWFGRVPS